MTIRSTPTGVRVLNERYRMASYCANDPSNRRMEDYGQRYRVWSHANRRRRNKSVRGSHSYFFIRLFILGGVCVLIQLFRRVFFANRTFRSFLVHVRVIRLFTISFSLLLMVLSFLFRTAGLFVMYVALMRATVTRCRYRNRRRSNCRPMNVSPK